MPGLEITRELFDIDNLLFVCICVYVCTFKVIEYGNKDSLILLLSFSRERINRNNDSVAKLTNLDRDFSLENCNSLWKINKYVEILIL